MISTLSQGTVIGGFTIGPPLGQGGFGITYLAHDNQTGRKFALKEYFPSDFAQRKPDGTVSSQNDTQQLFEYGLRSFITEANILRTLPRQRGLVQVRGAFERMGTAYCAMEFIEGEALDKMIPRLVKTHGGIPQELVEQFLDPVTLALSAIHNKKLIHRDVKPGNIMIRRNGDPVLIDFGAARVYGTRTDGAVMFTRKYAPIEQFPNEDSRNSRAGLNEGPWSDLYSLSVMLYEMISRRAPPDAQTRFQTFRSTGQDPYVSIANRVGNGRQSGFNYSPELLSIIDAGCALLPRDRPQDARAYRSDLFASSTSLRVPREGQAQAKRTAQEAFEEQAVPFAGQPKHRPPKTDKPKGAATMALIILALAVLATAYGMWGTY